MKRVATIKFFVACIGSFFHCSPAMYAQSQDSLLATLMEKRRDRFEDILKPGNDHKVQVIYTTIDRNKKGKPQFHDHYYGVDPALYFYPASTVKLPVAILALQKLKELSIPGLDRKATMITGVNSEKQTAVHNDPSAKDGRPTIEHYIKKILLVSDNDAYNRLYEFLGQEYINNSLHRMGFKDVQIIHRLEISLTEEENRHTNPVSFYDSSGKLLYEKPAEKSTLIYDQRDTKLGKGFMRGSELVNEPFDFSKKNRLTLPTLHTILKSILFPDAVEKEQRFNLSDDDLVFLRKYMSMTPGESVSPRYDLPEYWDTYVKFIYYGAQKNAFDPSIRIFNKPGDAYGFLIDAAYLIDPANNIEFVVSAVIHCNSDGIYNDNKYEYETIGLPFMKNLGRLLYLEEKNRKKKYNPDLSGFTFDYSK